MNESLQTPKVARLLEFVSKCDIINYDSPNIGINHSPYRDVVLSPGVHDYIGKGENFLVIRNKGLL